MIKCKIFDGDVPMVNKEINEWLDEMCSLEDNVFKIINTSQSTKDLKLGLNAGVIITIIYETIDFKKQI